jgi:hypothetical protein
VVVVLVVIGAWGPDLMRQAESSILRIGIGGAGYAGFSGQAIWETWAAWGEFKACADCAEYMDSRFW